MADHAEKHKPYHHGDLRNGLIAAGTAILAEEGVAALDLRKVARRAGVSHAAPYRHFADKEALLVAIAEAGFQELNERIAAAIASANVPRTQLLATARAYIRFACDAPAHLREMFSGLSLDRAAHPALYATSKASFGNIAAVIERGQQRGEIVAGDPTQLTLVTWATIHGFAMLVIERQLPEAYGSDAALDQAITLCIETLYQGLAQRQ